MVLNYLCDRYLPLKIVIYPLPVGTILKFKLNLLVEPQLPLFCFLIFQLLSQCNSDVLTVRTTIFKLAWDVHINLISSAYVEIILVSAPTLMLQWPASRSKYLCRPLIIKQNSTGLAGQPYLIPRELNHGSPNFPPPHTIVSPIVRECHRRSKNLLFATPIWCNIVRARSLWIES